MWNEIEWRSDFLPEDDGILILFLFFFNFRVDGAWALVNRQIASSLFLLLLLLLLYSYYYYYYIYNPPLSALSPQNVPISEPERHFFYNGSCCFLLFFFVFFFSPHFSFFLEIHREFRLQSFWNIENLTVLPCQPKGKHISKEKEVFSFHSGNMKVPPT